MGSESVTETGIASAAPRRRRILSVWLRSSISTRIRFSVPHLEPDGVVVRAFRPDAERIALLIEGEERGREMTRIDQAGLFEIRLAGRRELFGYRLEIFFAAALQPRFTIRTASCQRSAISTFTCSVNSNTSVPTKCSVRMRASWAGSPAWRSRSGRLMRAASAW